MRLDSQRLIEMEQNPEGDPGRIGDSCAETNRMDINFAVRVHLGIDKHEDSFDKVVLEQCLCFRTDRGYVRHPKCIWREDDFPGDQWIPLYINLDCWDLYPPRREMEERLEAAGNRYGNGNLIHPTVISATKRANKKQTWLTDMPILLQAFGFKFPYRWSDANGLKWYQRIERSEDSSADVLNWIALIYHAEIKGHTWSSRRAKAAVSADWVMSKLKAYYAKEPNSQWYLDLCEPAVRKVFP